jgi:hypothetical protein
MAGGHEPARVARGAGSRGLRSRGGEGTGNSTAPDPRGLVASLDPQTRPLQEVSRTMTINTRFTTRMHLAARGLVRAGLPLAWRVS